MRVLVCGSRDFEDVEHLYKILDELVPAVEVIIEGQSKGADLLAKKWAEDRDIVVLPFPANWKKFGVAAGPIRNSQMLVEGKPDMVIAFPSKLLHKTKGTYDMVKKARHKKIPTIVCGEGEI